MATVPVFLKGKILTPLSIVTQWPSVIAATIPYAETQVAGQLTAVLDTLNDLLDNPPSPKINDEYIIMPIDLVNNIKMAFINFQHEYGGPYASIDYMNVINLVDSVYDNYSAQFYNSGPPPNGYFIY